VLHTALSGPSKKTVSPKGCGASNCCPNLLHKPSKRPPSPSSRPPDRGPKNPPGLIVRGRFFHVRVRVPRSLEAKIGRSHVWRSLGTGLKSEAVRRARIVTADLERSFLLNDGKTLPGVTVAEATPVTMQATISEVITFGELFRQFLGDPSRVRAPKTQMIYDNLLTVSASVWGEDRPLASIDRAACRELLEVLRWLPSNPAKRFPHLSIVQAARMAKRTGLASVLSVGSINGYMAKLRSLMTFAMNEGWIDRNPATGLSVLDPVRERDKRLPFSLEQLWLIFNAWSAPFEVVHPLCWSKD